MNRFVHEIITTLEPRLGLAPEAIAELIEVPPDSQFGDYALPCFRLSKQLRQAPEKIANDLAALFKAANAIQEVTVVGGYLNFRVNQKTFTDETLKEIFSAGEKFGSSDVGKGKTIVIDFSSPNIAKPFGVGHLRSTVIGNALGLLYRKLGHPTLGINHLGDWGTQFGYLIAAFKRWGSEEALASDPIRHLYELYVRFNTEADANPATAEEGRRWFKKLESGDSEAVALWQRFSRTSLDSFQKIYALLGISFAHFTGESFYNDRIEPTLKRIAEKKLSETSQEALIVNLEKYGMPPALLRKKDDTTLYATRDLAAAIYRYETFHFHRLLYVVGSAQRLHFQQLFKVLELLGADWADRCVHVEFGWVKFEDKIMATRRGNLIFLEDVLDKAIALAEKIIREKNPELENIDSVKRMVGVGAVIFADLAVRRQKDVNFEWEKVLTFEGETGPYLQYTHARLASLERKFSRTITAAINFELLTQKELWLLVRTLADFPQKVQIAAAQYEPAIVAGYLLELAGRFNTYYQNYRIITEDPESTQAKMLVVAAARSVLQEGLRLLGLAAPERM